MLTRRAFVTQLSAALLAVQGTSFITSVAGARPAGAMASPAVVDAMNALLAFVVPGSDSYSVDQGVTTPEPGGVDAGGVDALIQTLDLASPTPPPFPTTSDFVVWLLDQFAVGVFGAPDFAGLPYAQKMVLFNVMEADPQAAPLAGAIIPLAANVAYSEAGVFDAATRTLTGVPQGWDLTGYPGVADGRDEFVGYYRGRKKATS